MASYSDLPAAGFMQIGGDNTTWTYIANYYWGHQGDEPVWNSRKYKVGELSHGFEGATEWVLVESMSDVDPRLYYKSNHTLYWEHLSDDEGQDYNFRAVIHFNGGAPSTVVHLMYTHYKTTDLGDYRILHAGFDHDPQETGCPYLEVYPDGTIERVWHH